MASLLKRGYAIEISIPLDVMRGNDESPTRYDEELDELAALYNGERDGSGCGLGFRDLQYFVRNRKDRQAFVAALYIRDAASSPPMDINWFDIYRSYLVELIRYGAFKDAWLYITGRP